MSEAAILRIENLAKSMRQGRDQAVVLYHQLNLSLAPGESLAIMGPSGCGKSTLLAMIAGLEPIDKGEIWLFEQALSTLNDEQRTRLRANYLGFVFQSFMLMPGFSVAENLQMAGVVRRQPVTSSAIMQALEQVGLATHAAQDVAQLSGGEQQRVALARAIVTQPRLLIADEPTGNLDPATGESVSELMMSLVQQGTSLLLATHDRQLAQKCQRCLQIKDGALA